MMNLYFFEKRNEEWNEELNVFRRNGLIKGINSELIPNSSLFDEWKELILSFGMMNQENFNLKDEEWIRDLRNFKEW